jgi:hypothetical protein
VKVLKLREHPRSDEKSTVNELTGDGLALHQITVHMTQYGIESKAFSSGQADQPHLDRHLVFLIGGPPYSDEFLSGLEEAQLADVPTAFGARFDMEAPLRDRKNGVARTQSDYNPTNDRQHDAIQRAGGRGQPLHAHQMRQPDEYPRSARNVTAALCTGTEPNQPA